MKHNYSEESRKSDREWVKHQMESTKQATAFGMGSALLFGGIGLAILIAWLLSH